MDKIIELNLIKDVLTSIDSMIDKNLVSSSIRESQDGLGFELDVNPCSPQYCRFWISVAPHNFDVCVADWFAESDISHNEFDVFELAEAIISGRVKTYEKKYFGFLTVKRLRVEICSEINFYSGVPGFRFSSYPKDMPVSFKSYKANKNI
jgi:hypothetical protein